MQASDDTMHRLPLSFDWDTICIGKQSPHERDKPAAACRRRARWSCLVRTGAFSVPRSTASLPCAGERHVVRWHHMDGGSWRDADPRGTDFPRRR